MVEYKNRHQHLFTHGDTSLENAFLNNAIKNSQKESRTL